MSERDRGDRGLRARRRWVERIVPGLPHLLRGQRLEGLALSGLAVSLLAILVAARRRIADTLTSGALDQWIALATLVVGLVALWTINLLTATASARAGGAPESPSRWRLGWREFRRDHLAVLGLGLMVLLLLATLLTPYLAPHDPGVPPDLVARRYLGPSLDHLMGTDRFGRDVFTRVLYGARISLSIGFLAVGIAVTLGTLVGAVSGFLGGRVDSTLMRFVDMLISFPRLVLLITVVALFEPSVLLVIAVLGLTLWPSTARIVRSEVLSLREREFVQAARVLGFGNSRIIVRHIVPNVMAPIIVAATLGIGNTILLEAGLSFLGLGLPPDVPSWGSMVSAGRDALVRSWWVATFPGLAIVITVVGFNLIGDALRDALDPRLRANP